MAIKIFTDEPMTLFVNVAYDTSWRAEAVQNNRRKPLQVMRAHDVMCAIDVPARSHHIEMHYDPPEFRWGVGISIAAWTGLILVAIVSRVRLYKKQ